MTWSCSEKYFIDVLPPGAGRVSLMRSLLTLPDKSAHAFVVQRVLQVGLPVKFSGDNSIPMVRNSKKQ